MEQESNQKRWEIMEKESNLKMYDLFAIRKISSITILHIG